MIDWGELESFEGALQSPQSDAGPKPMGEAVGSASKAVEHWRRNLERFPPGHIGHEYAREALEARRWKSKLLDKEGD